MNNFKLFLFLVSFLGSSVLFGMTEEERLLTGFSGAASTPSLKNASQIKDPLLSQIEDWTKDVPQAFIHFYWSVGRLPEMVPEDQRGPILIGGWPKYADIFFGSVAEFLNFVPDKVSVVMTCDQWTYETNKAGFDDLQKKFNARFSIQFVDAMVEGFKKAHPLYEKTLETVFQNACCGNPAIASDIYRLLLKSLHRGAPEGCILAYSDIDTFCTVLKDKIKSLCASKSEFEILMENLFNPKREGRLLEQNNLIKVINTFEDKTGDKVLETLTLKLQKKTVIPHFSTLIGFLQQFETVDDEKKEEIFQNYLTYSQENCFCARDIISETGPGFLNKNDRSFGILGRLEKYRPVYAISWYDTRFESDRELNLWGITPNTIAIEQMKCFAAHTVKIGHEKMTPEEQNDLKVLMEKDILSWKSAFCVSTPEMKRLYEKMHETLDDDLNEIGVKISKEYEKFKSLLSDLGFVKKFGEDHPFYKRLKMRILDEKSYFNQKSPLANLMRLYYKFDDAQQKMPSQKEEWAKMMLHQIKHTGNTLVKIVQDFLKKLGKDSTLSVENIMDMLEDNN